MTSVFSGCDFAAGWASGTCGLIVGHPLDTIKVWKQTIPEKTSLTNVVVTLFKLEGIKGFYKGMMFPLLTAGALNSLFFGVYGNTMRALQELRQVERTTCWQGELPYPAWHWDVFYSGCIGGLFSLVISCPMELVKTQMQTQTSQPNLVTKRTHQYAGPWSCLFDQYRSRGIVGCYRGFVPLLWRDAPTFGLYMLTYQYYLCIYKSHQHDDGFNSDVRNQLIGGALAGAYGLYMSVYGHASQHLPDKHVWSIMLAGAISGAVSWASIVPLDVIKSRVQADSKTEPKYKGMVDCAIKSYHSDGIQVFFRGFWVIVLRSLPVNAVTFVSYEYFISLCKQL